jgi:hypothetical protein
MSWWVSLADKWGGLFNSLAGTLKLKLRLCSEVVGDAWEFVLNKPWDDVEG